MAGFFIPETPVVLERIQGRGGELQLQRRGEAYEIIYSGVFLMATYNGASERAAVRRSLALLPRDQGVRVLMGGLGVGYSLQEALRHPQVEVVVVAEIEEAVIRWNRCYFYDLNGRALDDARVEICNAAFEGLLRGATRRPDKRYHLIIIDTDNGSGWLSRPENAVIYSEEGLKWILNSLFPEGVACFWCARRERELERRLRSFFDICPYETVLEETGEKAGFYLARKLTCQ